MRNTTAFLVPALLAAMISGPALAEGRPQAARGIVAEHCVTCHEVPGFKPRHERASLAAPPFQAIADQPQVYTRERMATFLGRPHYPMTQLILSPSDIDNLIALIESLGKP